MVDHPASLVETSFWLQVLSLPEDGSLSKGINYDYDLQNGHNHGLINYKDIIIKGRLSWCLIEFIDCRYSQSWRYFRPSFVNYCTSNLLSGSSPPPPPTFPSRSTVCTDNVWLGWGGGRGVELGWRPYFAGVKHSVLLTRFRAYKIVLLPETKT